MTTPAEHRRDVADLVSIAENDLQLLFKQAAGSADDVRDALMDVLPRLVAIYGSAAATLGADWYDDMRDAAGAAGRFRAIPAALVADQGRTDSLARWAVTPLYSATPDMGAAFAKAMGGAQRLIADADRETVIGSLRQDPQGRGWSRHTSGGCDFCGEIAARGAVYSAATADFASHDDCKCVAVPEYGNDFRDVRNYTPSQRFRSQSARDAHNSRTRAWLTE